ncbi:MAG: hypothetical protein ACFE9T_10145 [Promethearchaeota archaeon]
MMMEHYRTNNLGNNFFTINLETIIGHSSQDLRGDLTAYHCVEWMALQTQDINYGQFICDFYALHGDFRFDEVNRNDPEYEEFFDRIEQLLNWAVYYCACALKYHIGFFDGVCPDCLEDEPEETKKISSKLKIADFMSRFAIVFIAIAGFTALTWYFSKKI